MKILALDRLHERHPGLTPSLGQSYVEAACVCFSRHHNPPVAVALKHSGGDERRELDFTVPDARTRNAHANDIDATEIGAYGVSLAAVEAVTGLVAVRRAETLTGADWYVAPHDSDSYDLERCLRLEVSGVNAGASAEIQRRLREKVAQAARGQSNLPAIAAVVGFKALEVAISPMGDSV
jgi:hypothetical protein